MQHVKLKLIVTSLLILTGCHQKQQFVEEAVSQPDMIEKEVTIIEIEPTTEVTVQSPIDSTQSIIDENQLYLENGLSREEYETTPYLEPGQLISIQNQDEIIGTVSFDKAEIIDDARGSTRKGLLLWFTETNTTTECLEVGLYSMSPLTLVTVFKEDQQLKPLSTTPAIMGIENNDYLENYHLEYHDTEQTACNESSQLLPGESRTCYQLYSYAGRGDYLINQATDQTYESWKSYLLTIK